MKHSYLILIAFFTFSFAQAQIVSIPDENFKELLLNKPYLNTNGDGEIQVSEAEAATSLTVICGGCVSSLEGIEYFINIEYLWISFNPIETLDISQNINLTDVTCDNCLLSELNINQNILIEKLSLRNNELSNLNVSQNTLLRQLSINNNQLSSIDLTQNLLLERLNIHANQISNLDVTQNTAILSLDASNNEISDIDIFHNDQLNYLYLSYNPISNIDLSQNINLQELVLESNLFTQIDLSQNTLLTSLNISHNQILNIDVTQNINLMYLFLDGNPLDDLDINYNLFLERLSLSGDGITDLDLSQHIYIDEIYCQGTNILNLDLSNSLYLWNAVIIDNNNLESINFKNGAQDSFGITVEIQNNSNLSYLCVDDVEIDYFESLIELYNIENCEVNSYCSFVPGGEFYTIEGQNRFDTNLNGCDVNDVIFPNLKFNITDGTINGDMISNASGAYFIPVQEGLHTIIPVFENPDYFIATPISVTVDFPTETSPLIQDFCITPNGDKNDLEIVIIPLEPVRPGFDANYKLIYKNKGTTTMSGTFEFNYNENANLMEFVSSTPNAENNVANVLTWSYTDLHPFEIGEVLITMSLNTPTDTPPLNGGDDLGYVANIFPITGDETPSDNNFQLKQIVVNSLDPNDKTCLQGETITPEQVGKFVHYMIRFENTGTASAVNIVVKDEIDMSKYDVSTLIPLNASHDFFTRIKDDNIVEFIFEDIYLPFDDANNDGYVVFKIKTLDTLELGDDFSNQAEIYFDYNAAIITNDELTTVSENLSVEESELQTIVKIYPNPVSDYVFVESKNVIKSITIYDVNGRLLQKLALTGSDTNTKINISSLSKGLYFVAIKTDVGEQTTKIIKE